MSDEELDEDIEEGDEQEEEELKGEGEEEEELKEPSIPEVDKVLTKEEASQCLTLLGKTGNAIEYAYLKIEAVDLNLTDINIIPSFKYLEFVDVSGNRLRTEDLHCLFKIKMLVWVKAERNRIESLALTEIPFLQVLVLSKNKISSFAGINQPLLESLDLNHNAIQEVDVEDPNIIPHLRNLELRGNSLVTTASIRFPTLKTLYLAQNSITKLVGINVLVNLERLHLRGNKLKKLDGFTEEMKKLCYINIRDNKVPSVARLKKLKVLPGLDTLIVKGNEFAQGGEEEEEEGGGYRVEILVHFPRLKRIDKDLVQQEEIEEAKELRAERQGEEEEEEEVAEEAEAESVEGDAEGEGEEDPEEDEND